MAKILHMFKYNKIHEFNDVINLEGMEVLKYKVQIQPQDQLMTAQLFFNDVFDKVGQICEEKFSTISHLLRRVS